MDKIEVYGKVTNVSLVKLPDVDTYKRPLKGANRKKRYRKLHLNITIETLEGETYSFKTPACLEQYLPIDNEKGFHIINGNGWFKDFKHLGSEREDIKKAIKIRKGDMIRINAHKKTGSELNYVHLLHHSHIKG